jgi:hypothetical protein
MSSSAERESVLVTATLDDGSRLEWLAGDGAVIYVGSDPRCRWRLGSAGVAPFHWQLCWFRGRLWMAELELRMAIEAGWMAAPLGVVLRLGGTAVMLSVSTAPSEATAIGLGPSLEQPSDSLMRERPEEPRWGPQIAPALAAAPSVASAEQTRPGAHAAVRGAVHRAYAPAPPSSHAPPRAHSALIRRHAPVPQAVNAVSGVVDPDATQLVDADALRALPVFGPPGRSMPPRRTAAPLPGVAPRVAPPRPGDGLEDLFIVPAEVAAAPPRPPSPLARLGAVVPLRPLIALIVAGGAAVLVLMPESLHANRDKRPPATLPARRPPPDVEIEMRGVEPRPARSAAESVAARDLASGRLEEALVDYRALQAEVPEDPVFRDFATVIERRIKARCVSGGCAEGSERAAAAARATGAAPLGDELMTAGKAAAAVEAVQ